MYNIKVCGMRDPNNISDLIEVSPHFIGFIFHEKSPRDINNTFLLDTPSNIKRVGVFVNETESFILDKIDQYSLEYVQLHGNETAHFCKKISALRRKVIKTFHIHKYFNFSIMDEYSPYCEYFLFDTFGKYAGGNGIIFNWQLLQQYKGNTPFLLSGGIKPNMVEEIKAFHHPQLIGVDINSGFEIEPGVKDIPKIKQFKNELQYK